MSILSRFFKFGLIGVGVTTVHVIIAASLIELLLAGPAVANGIAFMFAACVSFITNARFTFKAGLQGRSFVRFLLVTGIFGGLSASIAGGVEARGFDYQIGIAVVIVIVPPLTFLFHNFWSFRVSK